MMRAYQALHLSYRSCDIQPRDSRLTDSRNNAVLLAQDRVSQAQSGNDPEASRGAKQLLPLLELQVQPQYPN